MEAQRIAIIGLGRVGGAFLEQLLEKQARGITLLAVSELQDTAGRRRAEAAGLRLCSLDEIVALRETVDTIFELTGLKSVRRELREKLKLSHNLHTVVAPESTVRIIWALISDAELPPANGPLVGY